VICVITKNKNKNKPKEKEKEKNQIKYKTYDLFIMIMCMKCLRYSSVSWYCIGHGCQPGFKVALF
jgi:sensor histidine kinase regulating citrate/malate metabolism